jgi:hypothetical protein
MNARLLTPYVLIAALALALFMMARGISSGSYQSSPVLWSPFG